MAANNNSGSGNFSDTVVSSKFPLFQFFIGVFEEDIIFFDLDS
jgi:hypothetical protein